MTGRKGGRRTAYQTGGGTVLVFGESDNDRTAIKELIEALCAGAKVKVMRQPLVLIKGARPENVPKHAEKIALAAKGVAASAEIKCVFAHQDADQKEPAHARIAADIEAALAAAGCPGQVHAVVPAWEIESWWFLWPDLVAGLHASWVAPASSNRAGKIENAKEALNRAVRPVSQRRKARSTVPSYRESDSIELARRIRAKGLADQPARGQSESYDRFRDSVQTCCAAV